MVRLEWQMLMARELEKTRRLNLSFAYQAVKFLLVAPRRRLAKVPRIQVAVIARWFQRPAVGARLSDGKNIICKQRRDRGPSRI
jgi:hypothetical protein